MITSARSSCCKYSFAVTSQTSFLCVTLTLRIIVIFLKNLVTDYSYTIYIYYILFSLYCCIIV
uniref:Uncharacterized protein n=1 Tax=Siphoviridae sp. ctdmY20 TaxID=2825586 RepID=A0A8S5Q9Y4_9CAUD|nr:MAG TPA: hypothetical protein [Siphoviridae sp. ctdmY20]